MFETTSPTPKPENAPEITQMPGTKAAEKGKHQHEDANELIRPLPTMHGLQIGSMCNVACRFIC